MLSQLINEGNFDVVLRDLPPDTSISDAVERHKEEALALFEGRVGVAVFEAGQARRLTRDEAEELEAALEHVSGSKITVYPAS